MEQVCYESLRAGIKYFLNIVKKQRKSVLKIEMKKIYKNKQTNKTGVGKTPNVCACTASF